MISTNVYQLDSSVGRLGLLGLLDPDRLLFFSRFREKGYQVKQVYPPKITFVIIIKNVGLKILFRNDCYLSLVYINGATR